MKTRILYILLFMLCMNNIAYSNHVSDSVKLRIYNIEPTEKEKKSITIYNDDLNVRKKMNHNVANIKAEVEFSNSVQQKDLKIKSFGRNSGKVLWQGVYFGFTNYLNGDDYNVELDWARSWSLAINPFHYSIGRFSMGLGMEYQRLMFADDYMTITTNKDKVVEPLAINSQYDIKRNTFKQLYITVPILFNLTPNSKTIYANIGGIMGVRAFSRTKVVYRYDGKSDKMVSTNRFSVNPVKFDVTGRIGIRDLCFFANYTVTRTFKKEKGPDISPLTLGVGWTW
ncbi:MAG: hypothetical protein ACRDDZ_07710 [Marinifilaceae bacterium]